MQALVFALAATVTLLGAQNPPRSGERLIDAVVATVNDGAIMWSELKNATAGYIRTATATFGPLTQHDRDRLFSKALNDLIDKHRMAQAVKSFGVFTPEQIEMFFQRELAREEQERLRDQTISEFGRELKRQGTTWPTFKSEQRVDIMSRFAKEFAVYMRLQKQSNLYLTPRMLRETYDRERVSFVHDAAALVSIVVFPGTDARATAERAAVAWREQEFTSQQLAARFPGAIALDDVPAESLAAGLTAIKMFALAGPVNNVSPPIESDGSVRLAKITTYRPARNGQFTDPDVQDELRNRCERRVMDEFLLQALDRARLRTEVWESPLISGTRRTGQN